MTREYRTVLLKKLIHDVAEVDEPKAKRLLDAATRTLKDFKGARVNQFAVQDRLDGLVERAGILNRDELGDALNLRVAHANDFRDKLMPEYLTLLLELSDHPIENADLSDLDRLKETSANQQPSWDDILRDDPLDNADGLWDNVNFAGDGSSDEDDLSFGSVSADNSVDLTSLSIHRDANDRSRQHENNTSFPDIEVLESLRSDWLQIKQNTSKDNHLVTELQIVREIIFMLHDYNTDLFASGNGEIVPRPHVTVQHLSQEVLQKILRQFSSLGERLSALRRKARMDSEVHVFQTYQYCLSAELNNFDLALSQLESRCITPSEDRPTLMELLTEARSACKKLLPLGEIPDDTDEEGDHLDAITLDHLFNLACSQQSVGNIDAFALTVDTFHKCFQTYLQPIKDWIFRAEIGQHRGSSFLKEYSAAEQNTDRWSSGFNATYTSFKQPRVPSFLRPFVAMIFNTGKTLKFLQSLGKDPELSETPGSYRSNSPLTPNSFEFTPFSEQFRLSFEQWLEPIHKQAISILSDTLRFECGLQSTIGALHDIFLGQHGPSLDYIADAILSKYADPSRQLPDSAILTAIYQEAFVGSDRVSGDYITVRNRKASVQLRSAPGIGSLLALVEVSYKMPSAISNIVLPTMLTSYRRIHVLLLQLRVAKRAIDEKFHQRMIKYGATQTTVGLQALRLSHRLRWFVHTLQSYFLGIAIQDAIPTFLREINDPGDLDSKIEVHTSFVHTIEKRLLLQDSAATAHQAIASILDLVVKTAGYLQRQWAALHPGDPKAQAGTQDSGGIGDVLPPLADMEESLERLKGFEATYTQFLGFLYTGAHETARLEGDRCLQMLVESLALGTSTQISRG